MSQKALTKYSALVIDNDMEARMRLKQATSSVPTFGAVKLLGTLEEGQRNVASSGHTDVIFIAKRYGHDEIPKFIAKSKQTPGGQDSAYILVLTSKDQDSNVIAKNVIGGADGFLLEPYSVDQLVEITNLAARVKRERSQEREAAALKFLVLDVLKQVDRVAFLKAAGFNVGNNLKKLKDMCAVFTTLSPESYEIYLEIAVKTFMDAPMPNYQAKQYKGVSDRVKKKMEAKVLAEIEAEAESGGGASTVPDAS